MNNRRFSHFKKTMLVLSIITMISLVTCVAAISLKNNSTVVTQGNPDKDVSSYYTPKPSSSQESRASSLPSSSSRTSPEPAEEYLITVYEGKVAVFKKGSTKPALISDVSASQLPEADLALLKKGIEAETLTKARAILEDYE